MGVLCHNACRGYPTHTVQFFAATLPQRPHDRAGRAILDPTSDVGALSLVYVGGYEAHPGSCLLFHVENDMCGTLCVHSLSRTRCKSLNFAWQCSMTLSGTCCDVVQDHPRQTLGGLQRARWLSENIVRCAVSGYVFKRVVARRAVYHTLNVITISLYVRPSIHMCKAGLTGGRGWTHFGKSGQ